VKEIRDLCANKTLENTIFERKADWFGLETGFAEYPRISAGTKILMNFGNERKRILSRKKYKN
jgi:hypothetical protein